MGKRTDEDVRLIANRMRENLKIKDRRHHFRTYRQCFVGQQAVEWLISSGTAAHVVEALQLGNAMMQQGLLHHVTYEHTFRNERLLYRFTLDDTPELADYLPPDGLQDEQQLNNQASTISNMSGSSPSQALEAEYVRDRSRHVLAGHLLQLQQRVSHLAHDYVMLKGQVGQQCASCPMTVQDSSLAEALAVAQRSIACLEQQLAMLQRVVSRLMLALGCVCILVAWSGAAALHQRCVPTTDAGISMRVCLAAAVHFAAIVAMACVLVPVPGLLTQLSGGRAAAAVSAARSSVSGGEGGSACCVVDAAAGGVVVGRVSCASSSGTSFSSQNLADLVESPRSALRSRPSPAPSAQASRKSDAGAVLRSAPEAHPTRA